MPILHLVVLAIVQGITEFFPISSSAHLILTPKIMGWVDQGPLIDLAVHIGTLLAVILYFRAEMIRMTLGGVSLLRGRYTEDARLFLLLSLASIPAFAAGAAIYALGGNEMMRNVELIGWTTLIFGVLLYIADQYGEKLYRLEHVTYRNALIIGLAQTMALIPGVSRSGSTMTAARFLGMERAEAARFSFLMSIPVTMAAGGLGAIEIIKSGQADLQIDAVISGAVAFLTALFAISVLMRWLATSSFTPFVIYRVILAIGLLVWTYF
ncbi:MAG: undecaprenyl-diphosphate phosphatase [Alphaproteobacteria bacterium]|nr:undecaprenyl-diphosphate phosphatase [Alphaproteobacteria bacterium]MDP1670926.1 undecaprenyl-diphosphate phosphatase [Alphaproteobacteria bacterium]